MIEQIICFSSLLRQCLIQLMFLSEPAWILTVLQQDGIDTGLHCHAQDSLIWTIFTPSQGDIIHVDRDCNILLSLTCNFILLSDFELPLECKLINWGMIDIPAEHTRQRKLYILSFNHCSLQSILTSWF